MAKILGSAKAEATFKERFSKEGRSSVNTAQPMQDSLNQRLILNSPASSKLTEILLPSLSKKKARD